MKKNQVKKLALAGMFCAVAVVGSLFSFPVFGSKCAPIQHMVNILCAVLLGPWYGLGVAFAASLIRNLLGLGSLMAFPGSMFGALICGLIYKKSKNIPLTLVGEVGGTSLLGGLCAYPVAVLLMGKSASEVAFYAYIIPFFISTAVGSIISGIIVFTLKKMRRSFQNAKWVEIKLYVKSYLTVQKNRTYIMNRKAVKKCSEKCCKTSEKKDR